jgi:hypothetical protein
MKQDIAYNSKVYNRFQDRTKRQVDVNSPTYIFEKVIADDPRYTRPKQNKSFIPENHLLQTRDIAGAYPGWINPDFRQVSRPPSLSIVFVPFIIIITLFLLDYGH